MYHDGGMAFDPEGLLSTLPAVCHVMVGFYCGKLLFSAKDNDEKIQRLFLVGTILTFAGFLLSYGCPINKKVWSPTFVITTCGLASSFLALLIWIIDIKGYQGWCVFFRSFGVNPLFIYVFAEIMGILLGATGASVFIYEKVLVPVLGNYPGSLTYALLYVLFCWSIVHILYKKGIYVKI
jgi:putative transmembrane protein